MTNTQEVIEHFLNDPENSIVFNLERYGPLAKASGGKPARISIKLPKEVCNIDTRDIRKWRIFLIAIKEDKLKEFIKE